MAEQTTMLPWYRRVKRWGQTNLTEDDPERNNIDFWREQWKRTRIEGVIVNCGGIVAYYPSCFGLQYRAETLGDGDYFRVFSEAAKAEGLTVIARMDINRATEEFVNAHPDWFCVDQDGRYMTSQGRFFSCVNSDYYKKYIPAVLTEIIERYHPAGFADNSWKGMGRDQICYCRNCRERFLQDTGLFLPEAPDFDDPVYRKWIRWSMNIRTENWDLFNETAKKAGGPDCLWFGMINADPADTSLSDVHALLSRSEFVFTDHQSRDLLNGFEQNHENGDLLHLASREDLIIPESLANYVRGDRTFRLSANPYEETRMWTVSGAAGGISPWYHHIGGGTRDRRQFETPVPFFQWHAENEEWLYDRTSLANVTVVWSQDNAVFYGRNEVRERVAYPWRGMLSALHEARIPFLPLNIRDLIRYKNRFDTLVLPDIAAMSDTEIESILELIREGKNLVVTGCPGILTENGEPREECLILDALGLQMTETYEGAFTSQPSSWEYPLAHTYLSLPKDSRTAPGLLSGFEDTEILGFGGGIRRVLSRGPLVPSGGYVKPFPIFPPEFSWIRETDETLHPFFTGTLETGSNVVYLAADIDRCAGRSRLPDHFRLLSNAVLSVMREELPVTVEGPGYIDTAVFRKGNARVIHLTNLSFANVIGYCHWILPVYGLTVRIPAEGRDTAEVQFLVRKENRPRTIASENGYLTVPVDRIDDFEVLVIH
ncbi:MAG: beta-galactosidase [Lachnospiraceae bacterium]|nr:beta-galactosidase [Lachnospiraceae bacterium]